MRLPLDDLKDLCGKVAIYLFQFNKTLTTFAGCATDGKNVFNVLRPLGFADHTGSTIPTFFNMAQTACVTGSSNGDVSTFQPTISWTISSDAGSALVTKVNSAIYGICPPGDNTAGYIIGGILGGIALLVCIGCCCLRYHNKRAEEEARAARAPLLR